MAKMNPTPQEFVEDLLQQAPQLTSAQYQEYRRELETRMARFSREERSMRWVVLGFGLVASAWIGTVVVLGRSSSPGTGLMRLPEYLLVALAGSVILFPTAALILLGIYLFKYRRRVVQSRSEARGAAIRELQRQLNELRAQLPPTTPPAGEAK